MNTFFKSTALAFLALLWMLPLRAGDGLHADWARTYRLDPAKYNVGAKIAIASDGIVVAGTSANANGDSDYLVVKYSSEGEELWTQRYDTGLEDTLRGLAVDSDGGVFVTGTSDTVKYSSGGNQLWAQQFAGRALAVNSNFVYVTGFSSTQYATVQLTNNNTDGGVGWVRMLDPTPDIDISAAVAISSAGNVFIAGWETPNRYTRIGTPLNKYLFCSYSSAGLLQWQVATSQQSGADGYQIIYGLEFDSFDSAYCLATTGQPEPDLIRLNSNGSLAWRRTWYIANLTYGMKVTPDNAVLCFGESLGAAVTRFSPEGTMEWTQRYVPPSGGSAATCVDVARNGNIYVAGYSSSDLFVMRLSSDGSNKVSAVYDSPSHGRDFANAIAVDKTGNVYVTGYSTTPEGGTEFVTIKYSERPKIEKKANGSTHVEFLTNPNSTYSIEGTFDFIDWDNLFTGASDATGLIQFDDVDATVFPHRVYRGKAPQ